MSLRTIFRPARNVDTAPDDDPVRAEHDRRVREARLERARREQNWSEVDVASLVVHHDRYLVHRDTDQIYTIYRGVVFAPHSANPIADRTPLAFTVHQDNTITFLELLPRTWTEHVERSKRRAAS